MIVNGKNNQNINVMVGLCKTTSKIFPLLATYSSADVYRKSLTLSTSWKLSTKFANIRTCPTEK